MSKLIDITGNKYGKLTVVKRLKNADGGVTVWKCLCECGNYTQVRGANLKSGAVKSCGCLRKTTKPTLRHNMSNTRLYRTWASIKRRCNNASDKSYKNYGKRGIKMCEEWEKSFEAFMLWAMDNGYSEGLTIERIDVNKGYCPDNCTWVEWEKQQGNRRMCVMIEHNGEKKNLTEWCKELGLSYKLIHNRIHKLGWSFDRAISEPTHVEKRNKNYV